MIDRELGLFANLDEFQELYEKSRKEALNTEVCGYVVDTCYTIDCGYETGICYDNRWIIVERYDSKEEAEAGHSKWVEACKLKPKEFYSVQFDENVSIYKE